MAKTRPDIYEDPNVYEDVGERRTLDLRPDGVECMPLLGQSRFQSLRSGTGEHVHPGCVEVSLCLRGNLTFESQGLAYPFLPGTIFVSQPSEPHRMRNCPKGLRLYRFLFRVPRAGERLLGLPADESRWLAHRLTHVPMRLFPATERVKEAFDRLFATYDAAGRRSAARRLRMRAAALDLLLSVAEAPYAPASPKGKPNPRITELADEMRRDPQRVFTLDALARRAGLSLAAFNDAFKRATGLPPHAYLLNLRIRAAAKDLADPSLTVAEAARRYNFASAQHFTAAFKRITGTTPRARRQNG